MPTYSVDIEKRLGDEYWSNRYFVNQGNLGDAASTIPQIVNFERTFHHQDVLFTKGRASVIGPTDDSFIVLPVNENGDYESAAPKLPLFNVVRVDFSKGANRPLRKYYRTGLTEDMVVGNTLNADYLTLVQQSLTAMLALDFVASEEGILALSASVVPRVAMRQLRRGSRRRTTPIIS